MKKEDKILFLTMEQCQLLGVQCFIKESNEPSELTEQARLFYIHFCKKLQAEPI